MARRLPAVHELFLESGDGSTLHAWHVEADGPLLLYFGGNAEEVSGMLEAIGDPLHGETPGAGWLLVDYRGYGLSEGRPGEAALVADALQWFDHLSALPQTRAARKYAFGRSLGSGVAVALAKARQLDGVILATPYDSLAAVAKRYYGYLPVDWLLRHRFDSIAAAPALRAPLLCLIAERDEVIPPIHAERLYAAWGEPKRRVLLAGAGHNTADSHPLFWGEIRQFLKK